MSRLKERPYKDISELVHGRWYWEWHGHPIRRTIAVRLSLEDWQALRLMASELCMRPADVLELWAQKMAKQWREG